MRKYAGPGYTQYVMHPMTDEETKNACALGGSIKKMRALLYIYHAAAETLEWQPRGPHTRGGDSPRGRRVPRMGQSAAEGR